jgi:C1A family cysteine protease
MKAVAITALIALASVLSISTLYLSNGSESRQMMLNKKYSTEALNTWALWRQKHGKTYATTTEHDFRLSVFHNMLQRIKAVNANPANKHTEGLNKFSDLTKEEFKKMHGYKPLPEGYKLKKKSFFEGKKSLKLGDEQCQESVGGADNSSHIAGVKDQGQCGSCWAFGANGALEGAYYKENGTTIDLSEQLYLDCAYGFMGTLEGCNGGNHLLALGWTTDNGTQETSDMPYHATDHATCYYNKYISKYTNEGHTDIDSDNECELMAALDAGHTVAVGVAADPLQSYTGGIYSDWTCEGATLDHAVTLVGYGKDATGNKYWKIKNSWGAAWGESGYFKYARHGTNTAGICSITQAPGYAYGSKDL